MREERFFGLNRYRKRQRKGQGRLLYLAGIPATLRSVYSSVHFSPCPPRSAGGRHLLHAGLEEYPRHV